MKYSNGSTVKNYPNVMQGKDPDYHTGSDEVGGNPVDPSVRLGPLKGEPLGCVPMDRTMAKPQAYKATKGPA